MVRQLPVSQGLFITVASRSHSDEPHSVGLLWTSDQPVAERPLPDNTTFTRDIHAPGGIRAHNPIKRAAADRRLRPRGKWGRLNYEISG
jgi:hypothetical protein